ncbi:tyrosine-type recombinase/integrase [Sporomusa termitida]|uniref:Prophage phiRv2 integrase n=1 Tax=Sporomusa termitida TaxID=2377 RepID=A0A517E028_9FIRM|nr:site-specific integrase [Sporomusa termitida]QDR82965.1 Putative prophage phiRv2 integrase [Sporomusa termitida]
MARAKGEGTISQRKDGSWIAQYDLGTVNGKRKRKTLTGKTKKDVLQKLNDLKVTLQTQTYTDINRISFGDYLLQWFELKKTLQQIKASTLRGYEINMRMHIIPELGHIQLQKLTTSMINNFYAKKMKQNCFDSEKPLSATTILRMHNIIHNCLEFAVRDNLIIRNVADHAIRPKVRKKEMKALDNNEIKKFVQAVKEYQSLPSTRTKNVYPSLMLTLSTGCRRGEILGLRWKNVDFRNKTVKIEETVLELGGDVIVETPKTEKSRRTISIPDEMVEILKRHRQYAKGTYVFPVKNNMDKPMKPENVVRFFRAVLKHAGMKFRFHDLRHTNISQMLLNGVDLSTAMARSGHSQVSTLMGYCHTNIEKEKEAGNLFAKFI